MFSGPIVHLNTEDKFTRDGLFALTISLAENTLVQIAQLRQATEQDHGAVEASLSLLATDLTREAYVTSLARMYSFVEAWESLAERIAAPDLLPLVRARARCTLLEADLRALQGTLPPLVSVSLPFLHSQSEFLGALYVIEGSRLGGQHIARHVDTALDLRGRGTSYFRGFGDTTGSMWKETVRVVETAVSETDADHAISAARCMFHAFGSWMSAVPPLLSASQRTRDAHNV